jgi:glyoxylase-like metal-dependent hydrolase (beta-lactamase superfamily II)
MPTPTEIADNVFVLRFAFYDQEIGLVLGSDGVLVIDTRSTHVQGREIADAIRRLTQLPVRAVVNTHFHYDHTFGNHVFRPASIWGHERCAERMLERGERSRARMATEEPALAADFAEVVIDPPEHTFQDSAIVDEVGREIVLRYLGRGHTDSDIVVIVPDAEVVFAGDLVENGATPYFGDAYPLDWPATADALAAVSTGAVVPGHGDVADRAFVTRQAGEFHALATLAGRVLRGDMDLEDAVRASPYPAADSREPLERAIAQLRGDLDRDP